MSVALIRNFQTYLVNEEKSSATVEKYLRDVRAFFDFLDGRQISKEMVVQYKKHIKAEGYAARSVNSMLSSVNSFLKFAGRSDCCVKLLKLQRQIYCEESKELTKAEYIRLLEAAEGKEQLNLILQTICGTGIRISELKYFTVESVRQGTIEISCKNKIRTIMIPGKLKKKLLRFSAVLGIRSGCIFINKKGTPIDRSTVWAQMKRLCRKAHVQPGKVFPHNLRKLFARTFYRIEKDIAKLADILGHGSINTTRIYIISTGCEHRKKIERLGLVV